MTAVMRLTKSMVDAGAAGIHFEDQRHGAKKCGHMGGKVLVSTREHIDRLMAARLQCDILGAETVIVARTDAEAAKLIESNQDPRDHGTTDPTAKPYRNMESPEDVAAWKKNHPVMTFYKAVLDEMTKTGADKEKMTKTGADKEKVAKWNEANSRFPGIANE
ncbi:isocitrate lyase, partial [Baffinella frigidus]